MFHIKHRKNNPKGIDLFIGTSNEDNDDLPTLYWILKLHKNSYEDRYIADSCTCSTKDPSITMTFSAGKDGLHHSVTKSLHVVR